MKTRALMAAGAVLCAGLASAYPTIQYLGQEDGRQIKMSLNGGSSYSKVFAGELKVKVMHSPSSYDIVLGYCADPRTSMSGSSWGATITDSLAIPGVGSRIGNIVNTFAPALALNGLDTRAMALQVAIWELLVETSGTYDVTSGLFRAKQEDGDPFSAFELGEINTILNTIGHSAAIYIKSDLNSHGNPKSQSILTPVPEPTSIAVLAVGATALIRRRRRA